jgi:hypothetical protein
MVLRSIEVTIEKDGTVRLPKKLKLSGPRRAILTILDEKLPVVDVDDELNETEWLKASMSNPAFDYLRDPEEDIYTIRDGKPFYEV